MPVRLIKNSWWVDIRFNHERFRRRSPLNTKGGAQAYEASLRRELAEKGALSRPTTKINNEAQPPLSFCAFIEIWLTNYVTTNNKPSEQRRKINVLKAHLLPFFGKLPLGEITSQRIEEYKAVMVKRGLKGKTINNQLSVLRKSLSTAVEWKELGYMPFFKPLKVETPKFSFLSPQEASKLVQSVQHPLWRTMILTALKTGMRYSELIALEWSEVDLAKAMLCVRQANVYGNIGTPKNGRIRHIPLTSDVVSALQDLKRESSLVFSLNGEWIKHDLARRVLAKLCKEAGVPIITWHPLRHSFASHLVAGKATLKVVQDLLGHATINMTMRYSHMSPEDLKETILLLEPPKQDFWATRGQPSLKEGSNGVENKNAVESLLLLNKAKSPSIIDEDSVGAPDWRKFEPHSQLPGENSGFSSEQRRCNPCGEHGPSRVPSATRRIPMASFCSRTFAKR